MINFDEFRKLMTKIDPGIMDSSANDAMDLLTMLMELAGAPMDIITSINDTRQEFISKSPPNINLDDLSFGEFITFVERRSYDEHGSREV